MSVQDGLDFSLIELQEVNLFVGISGSGKSKLLNSLFRMAKFALGNEKDTLPLIGSWSIEAEIGSKKYRWSCERNSDSENKNIVFNEKIDIVDLKKNKIENLVERTRDNFKFNGANLPKLDASKSCIELLKDEEKINPIYNGFTNVIRRNFSGDSGAATEYAVIDKNLENIFENPKTINKGLYVLFNLPLNIRLYFINRYFKKEYRLIIEALKDLFPNVEECSIVDAHKEKLVFSPGMFTPVFMVTEKGVSKKIPLKELSSGMVKVLLILTDVLTMPDGFIYELDEYENSLGVNVINFLPTLLLEHQNSKQFLITTHHPYLINQMPVKNWYVLSRSGVKVDIKYGDELVKRYGKSSQESFIKLINDPFYSPENK